MTRVYYKDALGAFIVFDISRPSTFDTVIKWKQDLDAKVSLEDGTPIPCVLLANKVSDTRASCRGERRLRNEKRDLLTFTRRDSKETLRVQKFGRLFFFY